MPKKRNCRFNEDLQDEFKYIKLDKAFNDWSRVVCEHCGVHFSIAHGGRSDINRHLTTRKHLRAGRKDPPTVKDISLMMERRKAKRNMIAASEALIAYHTVHHGQTFRANDCLSALIKKIYEPKFSSARTKSEAIIVNVLAPHILEEVKLDLNEIKSVTVSIDVCTKKNIKLFPIILRYFMPDRGVQSKIVEFTSLPDETSDLQSFMLKEICDEFGLQEKIVAVCADNTNTNFGCKRLEKSNVCRKFETELDREIISISCGAQIVHKCLQCAIDCLPIDVECFALRVCKYFNVYSVRVEELRSFCEFAENNYAKLLDPGYMRFSALSLIIDLILDMFDVLHSFFLSEEKCPVLLRKLFEDPCLKLWLTFVKEQVSMFQMYITAIEHDDISATEVALNIEDLVNDLALRKSEMFVSSDVHKELKLLVYKGEIRDIDFFETVENFYEISLEYINKWRCGFGDSEKYKWALLRNVPEWEEIQESLDDEFFIRTETDENRALEQWSFIKCVIEEQLETWNDENVSVSDRWVQIFSEMNEKNLYFADFNNIVEFVLCLPGSTSSIEKVFSIMNVLWSTKTRLNVDTMRAMLIVKQNYVMECEQFHEKVLHDSTLLKRITSSEKYTWYGRKMQKALAASIAASVAASFPASVVASLPASVAASLPQAVAASLPALPAPIEIVK